MNSNIITIETLDEFLDNTNDETLDAEILIREEFEV